MIVATIQISNHISSPASCTLKYIVEFKLAGLPAYERLYPDPIIAEDLDTLQLPGLSEGQVYDVRIARVCCDNVQSDFVGFQINT